MREEICATFEGLLVRRTSLFFWDESGRLDSIDRIAAALSDELDWNEARMNDEIERNRNRVASHRS